MPIPMTQEGADALRQELQHRKSVLRPEITQAIAEAREHGDLKENAEYHAAREQQSFNEGRITEIESKLADAQVIDISRKTTPEPHILILSSGEMTPFEWRINDKLVKSGIVLQGNLLGGVLMTGPEPLT